MEEDEISDSDQESYDSDSSENNTTEETGQTKSELSIEQLLKLREKVGSKVFNKKFSQRQKVAKKTQEKSVENPNKSTKTGEKEKSLNFERANKNRPQEMSSKRPVGKLRRNANTATIKTRDPRFDELCGSKFDKEAFDARFSFLTDVRSKEKQILQKKLRKTKNPDQKQKLKFLIQRMDNQEREKARKTEEKEVIQKWRREEKSKVVQGKRPFFLKQSEKKKLIQEHRKQKRTEKQKSGNNDGQAQGFSKHKRKRVAVEE